MIQWLNHYYSIGLVAALLAPLWLAAAVKYGSNPLKDALIWTGVLFGSWLLVSKRRGFQVRGIWRNPTPAESKLYLRLLLGVLLVDFGSKALFFRWDRPRRRELFENFGLHSIFHETPFELFHLILFGYFLYLFFLGARYFRFSNQPLDRLWLVSCTFALGGAIALFGERLLFGGVHNSFYFAGPLMWICPTCASPRIPGYAWTPADLFVHASFLPIVILVASYFVPATRKIEQLK